MRLFIAVIVASGGLIAACQGYDASRLAVDRDTLVLYGPRATQLPVRVSDWTGLEVPSRHAQVTVADSALLRWTDTGVSCLGVGTTRVRIHYRTHALVLPTVCRPARLFRGEPALSLVVGDAPAPLTFVALLESGVRERVTPVALRVDDTAVVRVESGAARAVARGHAVIDVELGGAATAVKVSVYERVATDSVPLVPGAFVQYTLVAGRYSVTVRRSNKRIGPLGFEVITDGAKCQRHGRHEDTVYCSVVDSGSVSLYSVAIDSGRATERAWLTIYRLP